MAQEPAGEKTEDATPKKIRDSRKEGNVGQSRDLRAAVLLLVGFSSLYIFGREMLRWLFLSANRLIGEEMGTRLPPHREEALVEMASWVMWFAYTATPFLFLMFVVAAAVGMWQTDMLFATGALKINFNKLNPVSGLTRLFGLKNFVMLAMNLTKLAIILPVAWLTVWDELTNVPTLVELEIPALAAYMVERTLLLAIKLAALLLILGYLDHLYQKWQYLKDLRMTKQEVKREFRESYGDPLIQGKRREQQRKMAMQRMMQEVPKAEVVVRNPTHYAIALSYKPEEMAAPVVVAKGVDKVALNIIDVAKEARVPVVTDPPLARNLYKNVEIGEVIPPELYAAVSAILAEVMRTSMRTADRERYMREQEGREPASA